MRNGLDPFLPIATFFFLAALFSSPFFLYLDNVVHSLLFTVYCAPPTMPFPGTLNSPMFPL